MEQNEKPKTIEDIIDSWWEYGPMTSKQAANEILELVKRCVYDMIDQFCEEYNMGDNEQHIMKTTMRENLKKLKGE